MRGTPDTMDSLATYRHVAAEVAAELGQAAARAEQGGVERGRIVVDPGFGFTKTPEQNFRLLDELASVVALGYPVAVGPSRKRFLGHATGRPVDDRDSATVVACALAWERGARVFRVQDRKSTRLNSSHGYISYAVFCLKKKKSTVLTRPPSTSK